MRVGDQLEVREVAGRCSGRRALSDGAAGPARAGGHADREPGRPLPRARDVLATADLICCEDTRRTRALLSARGITASGPDGDRLLSLHGHNEAARLDRVAAAVAGGATVAVVSDAGTPGISDPGAWLAARLAAAGETVSTVPGPVVGAGRAGRERAAGRPLLRRGVPAPQGARAPPPRRRAHGGRAHLASCSRRRAGSPRRWPSWPRPTRTGRWPWCGS